MKIRGAGAGQIEAPGERGGPGGILGAQSRQAHFNPGSARLAELAAQLRKAPAESL